MVEEMQDGQTGTYDETYDVIAVLYHALQGVENCQTYLQDSAEGELKQFFEQALNVQRQLADRGKQVLQRCLQNELGQQDSSAFGWGSSDQQSQPVAEGQQEATL